jgi:predicted ester cyclase
MKPNLVIFTAFLLFVFTACNQQGTTEGSTEESTGQANATSQSEQMKAAYAGIVQAFESGNTDKLGDYVSENSIDHSDPPPGITSTGVQRLKDLIAMYHSSFSNIKMTYHHIVADGDLLIAHGSWSANNTGPFMGMPATNNALSNVEYVDILRFENSKAAEHWEVGDNLSMMTQLGVIPQQGPAPAPTHNPTYDWNQNVTSDPARVEKMKETYKAVMNMIQSGDLTNLEQHLASDFKEHAQIPGANLPDGIEGAKQAMTMWKQVYPDMKITIDHLAAEGDILIAHFTMDATYSGSIPELPKEAAGKRVSVKAVDIVRFNEEGKGVEHWDLTDHYSEMVQLGIIPAPDMQAAAN